MTETTLPWTTILNALRRFDETDIVVMSPAGQPLRGVDEKKPVIWLGERTCMAVDAPNGRCDVGTLVSAVRAEFAKRHETTARPGKGRYKGSYLDIVNVRPAREADTSATGVSDKDVWLELRPKKPIPAPPPFRPAQAGGPRPGLIPKS